MLNTLNQYSAKITLFFHITKYTPIITANYT